MSRADCPAALTSARITGATSDGKFTHYDVGLGSGWGNAGPAAISLKDDTGHRLAGVDLQPMSFKGAGSSLPQHVSFWTRSEHASAVELTDAGSSTTCSASRPIQRRIRSYHIPTAEIYADDFPSALPPNGDVMGLETSLDATMVDKVQPVYPFIAREQGLSGTVIVEVWVGPSGRAENVKVYQSSGLPLFDEAAMAAARHGGYTPPFVNGEPTTVPYLIEYIFRIDGQPELTVNCGIGVGAASAVQVTGRPAWQLVDLGFYGSVSHVSGVDFVVNVPASNQAAIVAWQDIDPALSEKNFDAELGVLIDGSSANLVAVGGVRVGTGTMADCHQDVIPILDPSGAAIAAQAARSTELPPIALVYPAQFENEVAPRYPREEMAAHQSGYARLLFQLDAANKPVDVIVIGASTDNAFESAAVAALKESTFERPPPQEAQGYYRAYYNFHALPHDLASGSIGDAVPRSL